MSRPGTRPTQTGVTRRAGGGRRRLRAGRHPSPRVLARAEVVERPRPRCPHRGQPVRRPSGGRCPWPRGLPGPAPGIGQRSVHPVLALPGGGGLRGPRRAPEARAPPLGSWSGSTDPSTPRTPSAGRSTRPGSVPRSVEAITPGSTRRSAPLCWVRPRVSRPLGQEIVDGANASRDRWAPMSRSAPWPTSAPPSPRSSTHPAAPTSWCSDRVATAPSAKPSSVRWPTSAPVTPGGGGHHPTAGGVGGAIAGRRRQAAIGSRPGRLRRRSSRLHGGSS